MSRYKQLVKSFAQACFGLVIGVIGLGGISQAQAAGLMTPSNSQLPALELREHHVQVRIEDGYATTTVEQRFFNPNNQPLEAKYSFPVPERAAVGEFVYWIDDKPVVGEVVAKQRARDIYQQQKQAGQAVAITEKDEYRTFDSLVYPVQPNDDVRIKLVYIQAAHVDNSMGRYVYPLEDGGVDEVTNAFWDRNEVVQESFSFTLDLHSSYPLDGIRLPKHPNALITQISPQQWQVKLSSQAQIDEGNGQWQPAATLDQDILLYWRLQQGLPGSVDLVSYRQPDNTKGTFMVTLTPGDDLPQLQGSRDWTFVLDVSSSMAGKYATLLEGVRQSLAKLPQGDRFRLITFNDRARDMTGGYQPVGPQAIESYINQLQQAGTSGGTNLYAGLQKGLKRLDDERSSAIVLVTDGVANVGTTEKKAFLKLIDSNDVRLFTFIMGNSANRPLLQQMTELSNGFAASVSNSDDVLGQLMLAASKLNHAALRDVRLEIDGVRVSDVTPANPTSLYHGQQLVLFGHYFRPGTAQLTLSGKVGGEVRQYRTQVEFPEMESENPELERLWAYSKIEALQNQMDLLGADSDTEQGITDLAVEYGLVTDYTSLLVVEDQVFEQLGIDRRNQQRVELENQARQQREARQQVKNTRADSQQSMFQQSRPSLGGGAIDTRALLLMLVLLLPIMHYRRHHKV